MSDAIDAHPSLTPQLAATLSAGIHCVSIGDSGQLAGTVVASIRSFTADVQRYLRPALLCVVVVTSACGSDTPTTPTTTTTSPATETWYGIDSGPGGTVSRSFDTTLAGTLTVTLMSSDAPLGLGIGVPRNVNAGCR